MHSESCETACVLLGAPSSVRKQTLPPDKNIYIYATRLASCEGASTRSILRRFVRKGRTYIAAHMIMVAQDRVRVVVSEFEENLDKGSFKDPRDYAIANAEGKAREVRHGTVLSPSLLGFVLCRVAAIMFEDMLSRLKTRVWRMDRSYPWSAVLMQGDAIAYVFRFACCSARFTGMRGTEMAEVCLYLFHSMATYDTLTTDRHPR